jgi:colicin import membrane protein
MERTPASKRRLGITATVAFGAVVAFAVIGGTGLAGSLAKPATAQYAPGQYVNPGKVTVCHKEKVTIRISTRALPAHQAHGDTVGSCAQARAAEAKAAKAAAAKAAAKAAKAAAKEEKAAAKAAAKAEKTAAKAAVKAEKSAAKSAAKSAKASSKSAKKAAKAGGSAAPQGGQSVAPAPKGKAKGRSK